MSSLTNVNPNDNPEETERQSELARFALRTAYLAHQKLTVYRSLEHIRRRSLALVEKAKVKRFLDKPQDSQEVVGLMEKIKQAIIIHQVRARHRQNRRSLTRGTDVTTTVNIRPGRQTDREFLFPVSHFETKRWIQGIL